MRDRTPETARDSSRALLVLRHGKSAWDTSASTDFDRPLAPRGERDAPLIGAWMAERGLVPDLVISSPARRARQTTELVLEGLGAATPEAPRFDERIYGGDLPRLLEILAACPADARRVLVVGHNPGLEILLRFLAVDWDGHADRAKFLPTCTLAHLGMPASWIDLAGGEAAVRDMVRPKDLSG